MKILFLAWIVAVIVIKTAGASELVLVRDYSNIPEKYDDLLATGTDSQIDGLCDTYKCQYKWINVISSYEVKFPAKTDLKRR